MLICCGVILTMAGCGRDKPGDKTHLNQAEKYFVAGDYGSAEVEYKNALRATPGEMIALRRMGTIWEMRGSPYQAGGYFQQARNVAPRDIGARLGLARSLMAMGSFSTARSEALEALKIEPNNGEALVLLVKSSSSETEVSDTSSRLAATGENDNASIHMARAILAMRMGDLDVAEAEIARAVSLAADSPEVMLIKAQWHLAKREEPAAEDCLKKAVELAPARSPERIAYATYLLGRGRRDECVSLLEKTTAEAPDFLTPWRMLAKLAMSEKDPGKAAKLLEKVFSRDALDFDASILRAMLLVAEDGGKGTVEAISLLAKLKDLYPPNALVEFHLARARLMKGDEKAALENLDRALGIQPNMREAVLLQGRLRLSQARFDEVARSMESLLRKHPADIEATLLLSEACRKSGKAGEAAAALARIPNPPDSNVSWLMEKGLVERNLGKTGDARSAFEKVLTLAPSYLSATTELVALDLAARDYDSALRRAESQRDLHPESAKPIFLRAMVLVRQSKLKEAEEDLKTVLRLDPGMVAAYRLLVGIYSTTGRTAEAIQQMEALRKIDQGNIPVLMTLGGIYEGTADKRADARKCYEEILDQDPRFIPALNNLAVILGESTGDDLAKAQRLARKARNLKADDPAIADTLGWILLKQGDFKRAHDLLGEAAAALPDNPQVMFHRGMACRAMGDEQGARRAFTEAIAAKPEFPGRAEALDHLSRLEAVIEPGEVGIRNLKEQISRDSSDVIARLRLGNLLEAAAKHGEAAEVYAEALRVNPELHPAVSRMARLYAGPLNEPEKAEKFARKARDLVPGDARAAAILGALAFRAREYERADLMFGESLLTIKDDTGLMMQGAWAAYSVGRLEAARMLMETVVARSGDPQELAGGKRFLKFQTVDCTVDEIAAALEADPDFVPGLMARAALAERDDQTPAALQDYKKVLKIFPKFIPAGEAIKRLQSKDATDS